ncbi:MAG: hypothetical protein JRG80_02465 [Deltaproteobacteria bacterium]|nr:hypothetical protein [Deltaproteobacteria bacterium]
MLYYSLPNCEEARAHADHPDSHVEKLAACYREHPAWRDAAGWLSGDASSAVYFSHRPGEAWHLSQGNDGAVLQPGSADDPDLAFCFTPAAIERVASVQGGIGDFAVALFECITSEDPELRVGFRVVAPLTRLLRRGYVGLMLAAGPKVAAYGARHGIRTLAQLRRLVQQSRAAGPAAWEVP